MNYSIVLYILGCVLKFESAFLVLPALVGLIYREHASVSYLAVAVLCLILGVLLTHKKPRSTNLYTREGLFPRTGCRTISAWFAKRGHTSRRTAGR